MKFLKFEPHIGDVLTVSDNMSLRFEKIADDLKPVWMEIPRIHTGMEAENGNYVIVTDDLWFVFENGYWRVMTMNEHAEASRQDYLSKSQ